MREILFRGKKSDNGKWVYGVPTEDDFGATFIVERLFTCDEYNCKGADFFDVDPETIGQYTGLTDKSGRKIFEGDIVRTDNGVRSAISVVMYGDFEPKMFYDLLEQIITRPKVKMHGLFGRDTKGEDFLIANHSKFIEVIGNIHDNPELLKGAKDDV